MSVKSILNDKETIFKLAKAAFDQIDQDKSGFLEKHEQEHVLNQVSPDFDFDPSTKEDVDEILREIDANSDGKISLTEFQILVKQILNLMAENDKEFDDS